MVASIPVVELDPFPQGDRPGKAVRGDFPSSRPRTWNHLDIG